MHFTGLDFLIIVPIGYGIVRGLYRGFFKELSATIGVVLALIAVRLFAGLLTGFMSSTFNVSPLQGKVFACIVVFLVAMAGVKFAMNSARSLFRAAKMGTLEKVGGGLLGGLKILLVVSLLLNLFTAVNKVIKPERNEQWAESRFYTPAKKFVPSLMPFLSQEKFFNKEADDSEANTEE